MSELYGDMYDFDEAEQEQQGFVINNDDLAEWALKKIARNNKEYERMANVCINQIDFYNEKIKDAAEKRDKDNNGLMHMLEAYFNTVETKVTKTQATYILPSGKLVKKLEKNDFDYDEAVLTEALKGTEYVVDKPKLLWGEYKKSLSIVNGVVVNSDGEIVEEVKVVTKPATFSVSL